MTLVLPKGRTIHDYGKADLSPTEMVEGFLDGSIPFPGRKSPVRLVIDNTKQRTDKNGDTKTTTKRRDETTE